MSPVRLCGRCGAVPRACICKRRFPAGRRERRPYSDTAAYRAMRQAVLEAYGDCCFYGDGPINLALADRHPRSLVLAHVVAHVDGGPFELENLRPAHLDCNRSAGRSSTTTPGGPAHG